MEYMLAQYYKTLFEATDKSSDAKLLFEILDIETFNIIIEKFGGDSLYIPKFQERHEIKKDMLAQYYKKFFEATDECSDAKLLFEILDIETFNIIIEKFGGDSLYIPKFQERYKIKRNEEIKELYRTKKLTIKELAARYNITGKTVYNILLR